jgi:hypothetical protein
VRVALRRVVASNSVVFWSQYEDETLLERLEGVIDMLPAAPFRWAGKAVQAAGLGYGVATKVGRCFFSS